MISIILPTCNRPDLLSNCLEKLSPKFQSIASDLYEVIVTDDSSDNNSKELVHKQFPWAIWMKGPQRGPAANRNNGAKLAQFPWLIFIDDDCIPDKELLSSYQKIMLEGNYMALEGAIEEDRPRKRFDEDAPLNLHGNCFWSCNIAIKKEVFFSVNGFDENFPFPAMEDVDLYNRLKEQGNAIRFVPEAKVVHPWKTMKPFRNYRKWLKSYHYYINKNDIQLGSKYRIKTFKMFLGSVKTDLKTLYQYSFRGKWYFVEKSWYHFLLVLVKK